MKSLIVGALVVSTSAVLPPTPATAAGESLVPLVPARVLETRPGETTVDGAHQGVGRRTAATTYELDITGRAGVPTDAQAVMINATAVFPDGPGYLTVFPCGQAVPTASSLNYTAGQVVANAVLAKLGSNGRICIYTLAPTDIIVDVNGYVPATGSPNPLVPARVLETRPGETTVDGAHQGVGRRTAATTYELDITGRAGVPTDAQAVMINATAVFPDGPGYLTVFPCGQAVPTASSLNYTAGQVVANAVLAKLGSNGRICIYTLAPTDIIIDVNGYVPATVTSPPVTYETVGAGTDHACAVTTTGEVRCWGNNAEGQLGDGSTSSDGTSVLVDGLDDVAAIEAGDGHTCAIEAGGDVYCWGRNAHGQLGDGTTEPRSTPVKVNGVSGATRLALGVDYTCAIAAGSVSCWGINHVGQLGDGTTDERHTPAGVTGVSGAVEIDAGRYHTCVSTGAGLVECWGDNVGGMLGAGVGPGNFSGVAVTATGVSDVVDVAAGYGHTCALSEVGTAACWANNNSGQLGNGDNVHSYTPVAVSGLTGATAVTSDFSQTCALTDANVIRCWGLNNAGQLGNGSTGGYSDVPVPVVDLANVSSVSTGFNFACAVDEGAAYCWGGNNFGQLGDGTYDNSDEPVAVL